MKRRSLLLVGASTAGLGFAGCFGSTACNDEVACFSFDYQGADDAPSRLDIQHTGGDRQLRAGEVYITNVSVDWEAREMDTIAWAELDDSTGPDDIINGEEVQIKLGRTDFVKIVWRQDDDERVIEAWVYDDGT